MRSVVVVRLDRLRFTAWAPPGAKPPPINGFKVLSDNRPKTLGKVRSYDRLRKYYSVSSSSKIDWEYQRQHNWLRPWRVTVIGDDKTGITPMEVNKVLRRCRFVRITMVELAIDFSNKSIVNRNFVKRHGRFGKSRRRRDLERAGELRWGSRKSGKFVRCYPKVKLGTFRVELELHSQLLRKDRIDEISDLEVVAWVTFRKHCQFVRVKWGALRRYLRRRFGAGHFQILAEAKRRARLSLSNVTQYLRRKGVPNAHRFLIPMRINRTVEKALTHWAIRFSEKLTK